MPLTVESNQIIKYYSQVENIMVNKIAIAVIAVIAIAIIVPTAYAELKPTQEAWDNMCLNKEMDGKGTLADYTCAVDIYQMYYDLYALTNVIGLFNETLENITNQTSIATEDISDLQNQHYKTNAKMDSLNERLQILEGKITAPDVKLSVNVSPNVVSSGENFVIYGNATKLIDDKVYWVIYNPNGESVVAGSIPINFNNAYSSGYITPNYKWTMNGTHTMKMWLLSDLVSTTIEYLG